MTDNELRGLLLQWYYECRRERRPKPTPEDFEADLTRRDIRHVTGQLREHDLVVPTYVKTTESGSDFQGASITAAGIDVVEGASVAPIGVHPKYVNVDNREYQINDAGTVQAGDHNVQYNAETIIEHLRVAIQIANVPEATREKAKEDFEVFTSSPAVIETLKVGETSFSTKTDYEIHD